MDSQGREEEEVERARRADVMRMERKKVGEYLLVWRGMGERENLVFMRGIFGNKGLSGRVDQNIKKWCGHRERVDDGRLSKRK